MIAIVLADRVSQAIAVAVLALTGCAHSEALCRRRPPSPEEPPPGAGAAEREWYSRRAELTRSIGVTFADGMRGFTATEPRGRELDRGGSDFFGIYNELTYLEGGAFLYEQLEDGRWAFRCDDLTRMYALAAYRWGINDADYGTRRDHESTAEGLFCAALQARPEVVIATMKKEGLSPTARKAFEAALRRPFCVPEGGWRTKHESKHPPENVDPHGG